MSNRPIVGAIIVLGVVLLYGILRTSSLLPHRLHEDTRITLRLAHWNLHAGQREAYDALISEYEALHPDIRVLQLPVPVRAWPAWQQTQLIGGTAPDIMQIGANRGATDATIARFFLPLTREATQPNPYNQGSSLEGRPWRDTFFDGLTSDWVFFPALQDIHGIPTQLMSLRFYYNSDLLRLVTGSDQMPAHLDEFKALHAATRRFQQQSQRPVLTLAGSGDYGSFLTTRILASHTSDLRMKLDHRKILTQSSLANLISHLNREWSLDRPELLQALDVARTFGEAMPPGFLQLKRDDAALAFTQGRAVAMISGSWDYALLERECPFPLRVAPLPILQPGMKAVSEAGTQLNAIFAITRASRHPQQALDLLHYLTSQDAAARFAFRTQTLPATVEIPLLNANLQIFAPEVSPKLPGLSLSLGPSTAGWFQANAHRLFAAESTAGTFAQTTSKAYRDAAIADASNELSRLRRSSQRDDSVLVALAHQSEQQMRFDQIATSHILREIDIIRLKAALNR